MYSSIMYPFPKKMRHGTDSTSCQDGTLLIIMIRGQCIPFFIAAIVSLTKK